MQLSWECIGSSIRSGPLQGMTSERRVYSLATRRARGHDLHPRNILVDAGEPTRARFYD
jgi:hypothetical protein